MSNGILPGEVVSSEASPTAAAPTEVIRQFVYRQSPLATLCLALSMIVGFVSCIYLAIEPRQETLDVGSYRVTPPQLQWIMAFGALAALVGLVQFFRTIRKSLTQPVHVALTDQSILVPQPDWRGICSGPALIEVQYHDVVAVELVKIVGQPKQLKITHLGGKFTIPADMLRGARDFDLLSQMLARVCTIAGGSR